MGVTNADIQREIREITQMMQSIIVDIKDIKTALEELQKRKNPAPKTGTTYLSRITIDEGKNLESKSDRAAVWLYHTLKPYHNNKQKFKNAKLEDWSKQFDIIFNTHKRDPIQFVNLVKWLIKRGDTGFLQSASFFSKNGGKNYDTFLGIMEAEAKKNVKKDDVQFVPKSKK